MAREKERKRVKVKDYGDFIFIQSHSIILCEIDCVIIQRI